MIPRPTQWSDVGDPPPAVDPRLTTAAAIERLGADPPSRDAAIEFDGVRHSAVLVALGDDDAGQVSVLLTRRSRSLRNHSGEISFPGGRLDPGETAVDAARREAFEEVGLDPQQLAVVGELDHLATVVSRSYIVPVVATVGRPVAVHLASPAEVERVFWVPLAELCRTDTYRVERWGKPPTTRRLHFFELDDETVWGATAAILVDLLRRLAAD